jgi:hypothetical protein
VRFRQGILRWLAETKLAEGERSLVEAAGVVLSRSSDRRIF